MNQQERINHLLQINKRTGEIKTAHYPTYKGRNLGDVYGRFSEAKHNAYWYCINLLECLSGEDIFTHEKILSYGITSSNTFVFTFEAVFQFEEKTYVLVCTSRYDKLYLLES